MTTANARLSSAVAAARDTGPAQPEALSADRMTDLLRRYPDLADEERSQLIAFIRRGHPDELAKAVYGHGLQAKVIALKKDHPDHFARGWRASLPWLAMLAAIAIIMLLAARLI